MIPDPFANIPDTDAGYAGTVLEAPAERAERETRTEAEEPNP